MAVHPLRPATDRRFGGPLPRQLANQTRTHPAPINLCYSSHATTDSLCGISVRFQTLSPCIGQVTHALLTRPPLSHLLVIPKKSLVSASFDLHVLSTPPAFILSQDQTLMLKKFVNPRSYQRLANNPCFYCSWFVDDKSSIAFLKFFRIFRVVLVFDYQGSF